MKVENRPLKSLIESGGMDLQEMLKPLGETQSGNRRVMQMTTYRLLINYQGEVYFNNRKTGGHHFK